MTDPAEARVTRLRRVVLVTADLAGMEAFFAEAFAFVTLQHAAPAASFAALLGVPDAHATMTVMRCGDQEIGLLAFDPQGRPYPGDSTSSDLWFQHFAIIVADMGAAYRRLEAIGRFKPISEGGPQLLPVLSGGVTAFKFRDAEGHPLEFLAFPAGDAPPYWQSKPAEALFLGIDHSAIAVADTARSIAFYRTCFGLRLDGQTENSGVEQSRLDAVPAAAVAVTGLKPTEVATPHVELLGYHVGRRRPIAPGTRAQDIAATVMMLETPDLPAVVEALTHAGASFLSPGVVALAGRDAVAVLDPDGHRLVVTQA